MSILLGIHGLISQLLPRKSSTSSTSSVPTELGTDIEAQLDHQPGILITTTRIQQISSGDSDSRGETLGRAAEVEFSEPQTIFEHAVEVDTNPTSILQNTSYSRDQDAGNAGVNNSSKIYTPPSLSSSEASDFYLIDEASSDRSSDWEDTSKEANETSEMYAALAQSLDAELY